MSSPPTIQLDDQEPESGALELEAGDMVGEYRIEERLGEGGFGTVYRAHHPVIGKQAAVKVLCLRYSSNPEMVSRFVAEARAVNQIRNRFIVDIFSFGKLDDGRHFYVMELLSGDGLGDYLDRVGRLELEHAAPILRGIAKALDAAHAAGIAHRDLKPENVFLVEDDDGNVIPKVLDFGLAKLLSEEDGGIHQTRPGVPMGTPCYMSPEQCHAVDVDHRTDIYAFGVLVHRMLTGELLFTGDTPMSVMMQHVSDPPPKMSEVCSALHPGLDGVVLRMLDKDPDARPLSLSSALDALWEAAVDAGYDVPRRDENARATRLPQWESGAEPHGRDRLGLARTIPFSGADTNATIVDPRTPSRWTRRSWTLVALVSVSVVALGLVLLALRNTDQTIVPSSSGPVPSSPPSQSSAPALRASAPPSALPSPAASVMITIQTNAPDAKVFFGSTELGRASGPIPVPRSDNPMVLSISAPRFIPARVRVKPVSDTVVSVTLLKRPKSPPAKSSLPKDLEDPF